MAHPAAYVILALALLALTVISTVYTMTGMVTLFPTRSFRVRTNKLISDYEYMLGVYEAYLEGYPDRVAGPVGTHWSISASADAIRENIASIATAAPADVSEIVSAHQHRRGRFLRDLEQYRTLASFL